MEYSEPTLDHHVGKRPQGIEKQQVVRKSRRLQAIRQCHKRPLSESNHIREVQAPPSPPTNNNREGRNVCPHFVSFEASAYIKLSPALFPIDMARGQARPYIKKDGRQLNRLGYVYIVSWWQQAEKTQLRRLCRHYGILFSLVSPHPTLLNKVLALLSDFRHHTEKYNLSRAESRLDEALVGGQGQLETVLVMHADRTLAAEDTGALFWKRVSSSRQLPSSSVCLIRGMFSTRVDVVL